MNSSVRKLILSAAVIIGVLMIVVAVLYFVEPAKSLPSFLPGHVSKGGAFHHAKRGILALIPALGCFGFARFQNGLTAGSDS
jgi:hypothetical protein